MFRNILVAIDGSSTSQRGLKLAAQLASDQDAVLHVVHVVEDAIVVPLENPYVPADYLESMTGALREKGRDILEKARSFATERGIQVQTALVESKAGPIAPKLVREATKRKADLIVLGTHGRRGLRRVLLGSDAEMVLREARVPVLMVRAPERVVAKRGGSGAKGVVARPAQAKGGRAAKRGKVSAGAQA